MDAGQGRQQRDDARDARIGRILDDFVRRRKAGEQVREQDVLAEHPDLADDLREHFLILRDLRGAGRHIQDFIKQGWLERSDDPRYPACLGAYKIVRLLGRGGMGIVFQAYEESLHRTVALKVLRPELADDSAVLQRFQREARTAATLQNPNIVTVYAVGQERGVHFIAMEYVPGTNLADLLRDYGAVPAGFARVITRQLLSGLHAAHEAGLIHRDIKSSNVLLQYDDEELPQATAHSSRTHAASDAPHPVPLGQPCAKLADFGLARMRSSQTQLTLHNAVIGTPEYMSPEQARGDERIDHRTDLYSAGVVLYEMLTGQPPFRTDTATATVHRILHDTVEPPQIRVQGADVHLSALALRLMAKQPEDRFPTAADALAALESGQRIKLIAERRQRLRQMTVAGLVLALLLIVGAFARTLSQAAGTIQAVRVDPDPDRAHVLQAQFGDDPTWRVVQRLTPKQGTFTDAALLHATEHPEPLIVAAVEPPRDGHTLDTLYAYHSDGRLLWKTPVQGEYLNAAWPDCVADGARWVVTHLVTGNLNAAPGDELAIIASNDLEYPTAVARVNPLDGKFEDIFWHFGNLSQIGIADRYFPGGAPALIVAGVNNKLNGFHQPQPNDPPRLTAWEHVAVIMVLDPRDLSGSGPPYTHRMELPPGRPQAYAMLDLSGSGLWTAPDGTSLPVSSIATQWGSLVELEAVPARGPESALTIRTAINAPEHLGRAVLALDRGLALRDVVITDAERHLRNKSDWYNRWRVLVRDGQTVAPGKPVPSLAQAASRAAATQLDRVWIDDADRGRLLATTHADSESFTFAELPGSAIDVTILDADGRGMQLVVVGLEQPYRDAGLIAYTRLGERVWELSLTERVDWPDCQPTTNWRCRCPLIPVELNDQPGEEVIVVGSDQFEYPTRIAVVDPQRGEILSSYFHLGHIYGATLLENYFSDGRPALLAWGTNNKLDGFFESRPQGMDPAAEDTPRTRHDHVSVVMLLDLDTFDGCGPPHTSRLPFPAATPWAYGFVDIPQRIGHQLDTPAPLSYEAAIVTEVRSGLYEPADGTGPWFTIGLAEQRSQGTHVQLVLDRNLQPRGAVLSDAARQAGLTPEHFTRAWRPLFQQGRPTSD